MIDLLLRNLLLSFLVGGFLLIARRLSSAVKHSVLVVSFCVMLFSAYDAHLIPKVKVPVLPVTASTIIVNMESSPRQLGTSTPTQPPETTHPVPLITLEPIFVGVSLLLILHALWSYLVAAIIAGKAAPVGELDARYPVRESSQISVPAVVWVGRMVILLPTDWREWSPDRLNMVLRHETAHIERGDWWSLIIARLALAAFWPNPLVWWLIKKESDLSEEATDQVVIQSGVPAWVYATELIEFAMDLSTRSPSMSRAMLRNSEITRRINMLLTTNSHPQRTQAWHKGILMLATLFIGIPLALGELSSSGAPSVVRSGGTPQTPQEAQMPILSSGKIVQFQIRCKFYITPLSQRPQGFNRVLAEEPTFDASANGTGKVLSNVTLRTIDGQKATIKTVVFNGTGSGNQTINLELTSQVQKKGKIQLNLDAYGLEEEMKPGKVSPKTVEEGRKIGKITLRKTVSTTDWVLIKLPNITADKQDRFAAFNVSIIPD